MDLLSFFGLCSSVWFMYCSSLLHCLIVSRGCLKLRRSPTNSAENLSSRTPVTVLRVERQCDGGVGEEREESEGVSACVGVCSQEATAHTSQVKIRSRVLRCEEGIKRIEEENEENKDAMIMNKNMSS